MAIDTAVKRASVVGFCVGLEPTRLPDTISTSGERANIVHLYAGIAIGEAADEGGASIDRRRRAVAVYRRYLQGKE